jgi:DNA-binding transcriptional regulator GbsR (MarR family)
MDICEVELRVFEDFFNSIGFKRIEGGVFGLLSLSEKSLTSEEIEKTLNLSQSATSNALKTLYHYGAIETRENRINRAKLHSAKSDTLSIVTSIIRKRDQEKILNFKKSLQKILKGRTDQKSETSQRLQSMIYTAEIAESIINFVFEIDEKDILLKHPYLIKRFPKALELLKKSVNPVDILANSVENLINSKSWNNSKTDK